MSQTAANVAAFSPNATTGGILRAPLGTALPTSATAALDAAFVPLGYINTDGVQSTGDAASSEDQFAWGGDNVASLKTQGSVKRYTFKLIEVFNAKVAEFLFGEANVVVTPPAGANGTLIAIADTGVEPEPGAFVIDAFYNGKRMRRVIPNGHPLITAEDPLVHTALSATECQVTCLKDDAGKRQYIYLANDDIA